MIPLQLVALRKESVDRNFNVGNPASTLPRSLSARRAWIEIRHTLHDYHAPKVALRKESVDRNTDPINLSDIPAKSLSARRAWIEMD